MNKFSEVWLHEALWQHVIGFVNHASSTEGFCDIIGWVKVKLFIIHNIILQGGVHILSIEQMVELFRESGINEESWSD